MAKYGVVNLSLGKDNSFTNWEHVDSDVQAKLDAGNIIYVYGSTKTGKVYIGQSKHFLSRHGQHYNGHEEKFNDAKFDRVIAIYSSLFNGSSLDDVERQLIMYFKADYQNAKNVSFDFNDVVNGTNGNYVNDYKEREAILYDVLVPLWENVLMYDVLQGIRPANIARRDYASLTRGYEKKHLTTQFRIRAPKDATFTSDDYVNGIKWLLYKDTGILSETNFDTNFNRDVFKGVKQSDYFGYFDEKPLSHLIEWIEEDRNLNENHVNRILGGLVEEWAQKDGKNNEKFHWFEDDIKRRWNSTQENWINSTDEDAEDQIGSVFAVQGIDLNKVGVLIGDDLGVDEQGHLYAVRDNFHNINGVFTNKEANIPEKKEEFTLFVLNIYYVLLTRGIDGVRIGIWHNSAFKEYLENSLINDF